MKVKKIGGYNVGVSNYAKILKKYETKITKSEKNKKILYSPYSMLDLLKLLDINEYHSGCVSAISEATLMEFGIKNKKVESWFSDAQFHMGDDEVSVFGEFLKFYIACGNGFLIKVRNSKKEWVGLERLLPSEVQILENYDEFGILKTDYVQIKNGKRKNFVNKDVIHLRKSTHHSNAWGVACLPVAINVEILGEIKTFDYNNFKNGLLLDYFLFVEGGTLSENKVYDTAGKLIAENGFELLQKQLTEAKGNKKSHSIIVVETGSKDVKLKLVPMRQNYEGGFLELKQDLRNGIFAYHRTPSRVIAQSTSGQLGGDNNSDMQLFYYFVVKPLQLKLSKILTREFNSEYTSWKIKTSDFVFGNLTEIFKDELDKEWDNLTEKK